MKMLNWTPKTLKCQIYENNALLDLRQCTDAELEALVECIYPLWKTSKNSAIWFDVDVFEKYHLFKQPTRTIEVGCYVHNLNSYNPRKQVSISRAHYDRLVGKKFPIQPRNIVFRKWVSPMEVAFVA